jgi:hypothetical protein
MSLNRVNFRNANRARGVHGMLPPNQVVGRLGGTGVAQVIGIDQLGFALRASGTLGQIGGQSPAAFHDLQCSPATLVSGVPTNCGFLALAAGTWDVEGTVTFNPSLAGAATFTRAVAGISQVSATLPAPPALGGYADINGGFSIVLPALTISTGVCRVTIPGGGGGVYLVAEAVWS